MGANNRELLDVYNKQIRSILEFAVPVWSGSITGLESDKIERVQTSLCAILLGHKYGDYKDALLRLGLDSLSSWRINITRKFAHSSSLHPNFQNWFKAKDKNAPDTRSKKNKYLEVNANKSGLRNGPIAKMTTLLNDKKETS